MRFVATTLLGVELLESVMDESGCLCCLLALDKVKAQSCFGCWSKISQYQPANSHSAQSRIGRSDPTQVLLSGTGAAPAEENV